MRKRKKIIMSIKVVNDLAEVNGRISGADLLLADLFWWKPLLDGYVSGDVVEVDLQGGGDVNARDRAARVAAVYRGIADGDVKKVVRDGGVVLVKV